MNSYKLKAKIKIGSHLTNFLTFFTIGKVVKSKYIFYHQNSFTFSPTLKNK